MIVRSVTGKGAALAAACWLLWGCESVPHQRLVETSAPVPPPWVHAKVPPKDGYEFFVGRAVGVNTLDERRALLKAKHDAAYNIAFSILAEVQGFTEWNDYQRGDDARGEERGDTRLDHTTRVLVAELVSGMRLVDTYWELWELRKQPAAKDNDAASYYRYKYYVLLSLPQEELARLRNQAKKNNTHGLSTSLPALSRQKRTTAGRRPSPPTNGPF